MKKKKIIFLFFSILFFFIYSNIYSNFEFEKKFEKNNYKKKILISFFYKKNKKNYFKNNYLKLENDYLKIIFSKIGGTIKKVILKNYNNNKKIKIIKDNLLINTKFKYYENGKKKYIDTKKLFFFKKIKKKLNNIFIIFKHSFSKNFFLEIIYKIPNKKYYNKKYYIDFSIKIHKPKNINIKNNKFYLFIKQFILPLEKFDEKKYTNLCYNKNNKIFFLKKKKKNINNILWIAYKQKFFSSIFLFTEKNNNITIIKKAINKIKLFITKFYLPINNEFNIKLYFGPIDYKIFNFYNENLEKIIQLGWGFIKWINIYFFLKIFLLLEKKKINYGIIIIIITIIVKIILLPINYKQYKLNKIINLINKKIEKKNFNSIIEKQKEIIKNYKKFGINPFTSLIIIIFQIVIFSSLFNLFNNLINLRKKKFLWINDLSYYDSIYNFNFSIPLYGNHISLLTLIYIISSFLLNKFNKNNFYNNKKNEFNKYLFSLLFMLSIINNYSSSLSLYYCVYNILNIFTILIFNF